MKKIIFLEDATEMGGVQHSTINFIKGASRSSHEFSFLLLLPGKGGFSQKLDEEAIPYKLYPSAQLQTTSFSLFTDALRLPNPVAWWRNIRRLKRVRNDLYDMIKEESACLIMTKGMGSHFLGGPLAKKLDVPCLMYLQDEISRRYLGFNVLVFNIWLKKYAQLLVADGGSIKMQLWKRSRNNCKVIYNGVSKSEMDQPDKRDAVRNSLHIPSDAYVLGHLARITPWKGQHVLLEAFIQMAKKDKNMYLILMGSALFNDESYLNGLMSKVDRANLTSRVIFTGYIHNPGDYFSALDLFVYPSVEKDTAPLALLSALMSGKPVLMSDISSLDEIRLMIPEIETFQSGNVSDLIHRVNEMRNRPPFNPEIMKDKAYRFFSIEAMTKQVLSLTSEYCR